MKRKLFIFYILLIATIGSFYSARAQSSNEISSLYFSNPTTTDTTLKFASKYCGKYHLEKDTLSKLIVTPDSLYLRYFYITSFSKKELKKAKHVKIKDDLVFGIKEGQGLPYEIHNDTLYTVLIQKETFFKNGNGQYLDQLNDNTYILNHKIDDDHFYIEILKFSSNGLSLSSLEHEDILDEIKSKITLQEGQFKGNFTYLAEANKSTITTLINLKGFSDVIQYIKF